MQTNNKLREALKRLDKLLYIGSDGEVHGYLGKAQEIERTIKTALAATERKETTTTNNWTEICAKCKDGDIEPKNCEYYGEPNGCNSPIYGEHPAAEKSSAVGNAAALREALKECANMGEQIDYQLGSSDETVYAFRNERSLAHNISECARAALAEPPRNCDMPLVVDGPADNNADKAWLVFKRNNPDAYFDVSGLLRCIDWLLTPATKGGAK